MVLYHVWCEVYKKSKFIVPHVLLRGLFVFEVFNYSGLAQKGLIENVSSMEKVIARICSFISLNILL